MAVLSFQRIGWCIKGPSVLEDDGGKQLNLMRLSPKAVVIEVLKGTRRWADRSALDGAATKGAWAAPIFWEVIRPWT